MAFFNTLRGKGVSAQEKENYPLKKQVPDRGYLDEVRKAWEEWQAAQNYFENVSDPDLIDYAIYDLEAARRKYMYMLKQARSRGLKETRLVI